ncbi:ABC transporter substrate-binding protein [Limibaculum sp. M0105]|uniref:ABC transporter substrate-binding protein n=1 Tax=Thermohalobaculum xanthum TaxID=2753746 RepID=A0A8J7M4S7_9RHOB|nr:ABC transporter substrate-binding protein [Thermohalobaculum xanthum]MBK0398198.1 ABC transporter substrate-binding protein [Thermohalobaculum xanthum]
MTLRKVVAAAALAVGGMIGAAQAADDPVKVGVIFPLSGGAGPQGQHISHAMAAMAEMINEDGGVLGRPIELLIRDDESTPAVGVSRASELISEEVSVIIEGWNSPVTLAMQPVISRADILDITAISKADPILSGEGNPLAIRLNSSNAQDGTVIAKYIADKGFSRVAFLTENDAYGQGAQASIEGALKSLGHNYEVVAVEQFPFDQADFRVALTNVRSANPEVTIAINANEGLGMPAIIRQAHAVQLPGELVAAVGTIAPSVISVAGPAANGLIGADIYFPGIEPFSTYPANQRFIAKTEEKFQETPDKFMALGALALQVWAMAANEVESLEKTPIAERIRGGSFSGTILGDITFADNGQLASRHYLFDVVDEKIVVRPGQ